MFDPIDSGDVVITTKGPRRHPGGFSLVELLVVIAIIGVLIALLLPAVQAAREAARRLQCANHLKQLGVALHGYHSAHESLPAGSFHAEFFGVGTCNDYSRKHTWLESILPYIDQQMIYDRLDFRRPGNVEPNGSTLTGLYMPNLACPSDSLAGLLHHDRLNTCGECDYGPAKGGSSMGQSYAPCGGPLNIKGCIIPPIPGLGNCQSTEAGTGGYGAPGMFAAGGGGYPFRECTDGLSHTFLLGEQLPSWAPFQMYFVSHLNVATTNIPPNYHLTNPRGCLNPSPCYKSDALATACRLDMSGFKSEHPGIVQMAMGDGSVVPVAETIEYETWVRLGDRADGRGVSLP